MILGFVPCLMPSAPSINVPAGSRTFPLTLRSSDTLSDSSLNTENTRDNLPIANTLFLMTCRRSSRSSLGLTGVAVGGIGSGGTGAGGRCISISSSSSSLEHIFNIEISISVTVKGYSIRIRKVTLLPNEGKTP